MQGEKMRALITGGAGFVGSHLAEALLRQGHRVVALDDLSTGSIANVVACREHPEFTLHIDSVFNQSLLAELVDDCDVVFHLAAAVGVRLIVESPVRTLDTNVRGTELLLRIAAKKRRKVLITSTSEVYGKSTQIPFREDGDLVLGPTVRERWSYACSKAVDEFLALGYYREKKVPVVIARLFNTVGPRQTGAYGMVLPRLVGQALAGQSLTIYGDGQQSRCFGWVGDVADALMKLAQLPAAEGKVFNIGSDQEVTILQLAELILERTGSNSLLQFIPYEQAYGPGFEDMYRRVPDLARIREAIGYAPTKDLSQIVEAVIASMKAEQNGRAAVGTIAAAAAAV
jgi:UDP-glucose 4-epimerase